MCWQMSLPFPECIRLALRRRFTQITKVWGCKCDGKPSKCWRLWNSGNVTFRCFFVVFFLLDFLQSLCEHQQTFTVPRVTQSQSFFSFLYNALIASNQLKTKSRTVLFALAADWTLLMFVYLSPERSSGLHFSSTWVWLDGVQRQFRKGTF